jgi:hypothetical protein
MPRHRYLLRAADVRVEPTRDRLARRSDAGKAERLGLALFGL